MSTGNFRKFMKIRESAFLRWVDRDVNAPANLAANFDRAGRQWEQRVPAASAGGLHDEQQEGRIEQSGEHCRGRPVITGSADSLVRVRAVICWDRADKAVRAP
mgnify:CR=1 FL=1